MNDAPPSNLREGCLLILRYFGTFDYPLTLPEIHRFNRIKGTPEEIREMLEELTREAKVYQSGIYFMAENKEDWVRERLKGRDRALKLLKESGKYAWIISAFPFVRGIAISGSLSKYHASEHPDIDYFIITAANRLWIARTWLHVFKKLTFITGHQHYFCMNYFIDTEALKITHPNQYTAIEICTLLPVYHEPLIRQFLKENAWALEYLPNHPAILDNAYLLENRSQPLKKALELLMDVLFPGFWNRSLMKLTDAKWRRKWRRAGYPEEEYDRAFLTELHISKNHPVDYEKVVLQNLSHYKSNGSISS